MSYILGAVCHYLMLVSCFWLFCYVVNTFVLLVLNKHHIFTNPTKLHAAQLVMCAILPFVFVGICLLVEKPSYQIMFKDRMAILPSSHVLVFCTVTLPVSLSAGVSLTMLVAVVRRIRKVSSYFRSFLMKRRFIPLGAFHVTKAFKTIDNYLKYVISY